MIYRQHHTEGELGIILEEGVGPCRTAALLIHGVRNAGHCGAPGLRAAGGICPVDTVAVKLSEQLCVRSLAAASACCRELEQRTAELASLDRIRIENVLFLRKRERVLPGSGCVLGFRDRDHSERFLLCRTYIRAASAARAVELRDLHSKVHTGSLFTHGFDYLHAVRHSRFFFLCQKIRTNDCVRADICAAVALDAFCRIPYRNPRRDAALFKCRKAHIHDAILIPHQAADRQVIALLLIDRVKNLGDIFRNISRSLRCVLRILPVFRNFHFHISGSSGIDGRKIFADDVLALGEIGLLRRRFHEGHGILHRDDRHDVEESGLKDHVEVTAEAELTGNLNRIDRVEADALCRDLTLCLGRQMLRKLLRIPRTVDEQAAARLHFRRDVIFLNICRVVAGDEVR